MATNNPFELGKNRIEALSDGVFAIAMTILVLGFKLPVLPPDSPNVLVAPAIFNLWPAFVTYVVAFVGLGVYWILHHMVFHIIRTVDRMLLWLNILFFLFISILPLSVQLMNSFLRAPITPVLFGVNLALVGWLLYIQWAYALAHPKMINESLTRSYRDAIGLRILVAPIATTLTALICFWSVPTSLAVYALLLPFYIFPSRQERSGHYTAHPDEHPPSRIWLRRLLIVGGIFLSILGWVLFRPDLLFTNAKVHENLPSLTAHPLISGEFQGLAHETHGKATILESGGRRILRFTGFFTSNGPDVHVYLVAAPDASQDETIHHAGFINLGKMKGNQGDQNYDLPPEAQSPNYRSVSLWCERFNVNFGSCSLR